MQLHSLYVFLTEKFANIDARFDENDLKHDEILNAIAEDNAKRDSTIRSHAKRITKLERLSTSH
ncbi:MAG: hypothetical protein WA030_03765 [Candidatus Microsaccharimonas sp.]